MKVLFCKINLSIPHIHSLKDKRSVVKRTIHQVRAKYNVSIAEVALQDLWKTAELGFSMVGNDRAMLEKNADSVVTFIERLTACEVTVQHMETITA